MTCLQHFLVPNLDVGRQGQGWQKLRSRSGRSIVIPLRGVTSTHAGEPVVVRALTAGSSFLTTSEQMRLSSFHALAVLITYCRTPAHVIAKLWLFLWSDDNKKRYGPVSDQEDSRQGEGSMTYTASDIVLLPPIQ